MTQLRPGPRGVLVAAFLAGLLGVAAGCSGGDDPSAEPSSSPSGGASEATDAASGDEPASTQVFPDMGDDFTGIAGDVTTQKCPVRKGDVVARGTVVNSADEPQDIFIGVIWLKKNSGDSVAPGSFTAKDVGAGEEINWSVEAELRKKPERCVLQAKANDVGTL